MKVVTVASDTLNKAFNTFLKPSCGYYKLDALVLEYDGVFFSNRLKDILLNTYLQDISDDEIIFFTDATDTVFVTNEEEICEKFMQFNSPLVFSAEINCWPDRKLEENNPALPAHFKY
ncbi:MAG: glycosyltransferase domain-containing protein [Mucilaginibacter sp.]